MGVTVDKSRGNTIAEGVSVKSITEGGSAALARSPRGVGLKLGDQIIAVNGTHLRGMDQEDVIKIFRDLPSSTQKKIRRSKLTSQGLDSTQRANKKTEPAKKSVPQHPTPLPKPPGSKRRSSLRGKVKPGTQEERFLSSDKTDEVPSSECVKKKKESDAPRTEYVAEKKDHNGIIVPRNTDEQERSTKNEEELRSASKSRFKEQIKPVTDVISTDKHSTNKNSEKVKDELGDNLMIPFGYRKMEISIKKGANSTLGLSLVPSYGNLKGYFQIRRLQSGMVCAQDGQLQTGDKLVSVNGASLKGVTHSMALQLLKKPTEVVTFVILREGVDRQEKISSKKSESKSDLSSGQDTTVVQECGVHGEPSSSLKGEEAKTLPCAEKAVSLGASQQSRESEKLGRSDDSYLGSDEDVNVEEDVPELPSSPPPPPLLDVDDFLESDLSVAPPSFSPPPSPVPKKIDYDLSLSPIPVVSPPPDLSPRMKEFLEQDPFRTDHHESNRIKSIEVNEISPESSSSKKKACSPGKGTGTSWDFQSLLDACNDLNSDEKDDEFTSERTTSAEATSLSGNCKPGLPSKKMKTKDTHSEKLLETSTGSKKEGSGYEKRLQDLDLEIFSAKPEFGVCKGPPSSVKGHHTKNITTPNTTEHKIGVDVKPKKGRRVENVPFAITYQRKFRNLGFKVDLTRERKVIVSDVKKIGLVGKDGNIRVGDVLLSINDSSLEGMALKDVQNMVKNCPRGDVRIVAQAGPKPPKPTEYLDETVSFQKKKGQLEEIPDLISPADREAQPSVFPSVAAQTPWVDIPNELISLKTAETSGGTVSNLLSSNIIPDSEESVTSITLSQELTDDLITTEGCEDSELEETEFDGLPPSAPPPPLPRNDTDEESYSGEVPEKKAEDIGDNVPLSPPANFEDFVDESIESALSFDPEVEEVSTLAPQPPRLFSEDAQSPSSKKIQKKENLKQKSDIQYASQEKQKRLPENLKQQIPPIKPPRLFGDNVKDESIHQEVPLKAMNYSCVEDAAALESLPWNGLDKSPIKPPSLFDDELESLPSLPSAPPPPKPRRQFISLDTDSSTSSSPLHSCRFDRESPSHSPNIESSNLMVESGSSSPSHGHTSIFGIPDAFSDVPIQPLDDVDDDMSSLPPAPPPPRCPVNRSSSWSVKSDESVPSPLGDVQPTHNTNPLPHPVKPERKNSKKRILPLPSKSKRGKKPSEQSGSSGRGNGLHESLAHPIQVDFVAPITSSDANEADSLTHVEPPDDDMESLPPAPPPPRISPLTVESLESFADGLQVVNVKTSPAHSALEEDRAISSSSVHPSQSSPKKKKKSFRRNVIEMEAEGFIPESGGVSVHFPVVHERDRSADGSWKHLAPLEDDVAVTDSSDAMSPPPLPPEMELWSEAGAAEAELALLDRILTLEDSSRSGNEQDSEGGSSSSCKPPSFFTELSNLDTKSSQSKEGSTENTYQETLHHSMMSTEGFGQTNIAFSSQEELSDTDSGGTPDLEPKKNSSSINSTEANVESKLYSKKIDLRGPAPSNTHFKSKGKKKKQVTGGEDPAENFTKQRRPAPPIPARPPAKSKASGTPRKSLPGGIAVLPSKPDVKPKAISPSQEPTQQLKKEPERLSSPMKEKSTKKLFSRSHKSKDKKADPNHLQSPDTSFDTNPKKHERSRSWTKKLFGFRSRSRSKNREKPKDRENRSRSVSKKRGLFSRSKRSSPPLPPPTTNKDFLSKQKKEIGRNGSVYDDVEKPIFDETKVLSQTLPYTFKLSDPSSQRKDYVERHNNKFGVSKTNDEGMRPAVATKKKNFQQSEDGSSIEQDESCKKSANGENDNLDHHETEFEIDIQGASLFTDDDDVVESHVLADVDTSLANRPLPPSPPRREKQPNVSAVITAEYEERNAVKDNFPTKSPYKPPVPKKPTFLKSGSTPSRQQKDTIDELKQKINKERLGTSPFMTGNLTSDTEDNEAQNSDVFPSPDTPVFKAMPPPLALQASSSLAEKDDFNIAPLCPNSPGPPRFKPKKPPLSLKAVTVQENATGDETSVSPVSPGPPNFKPAPPPKKTLVPNKNIGSGNEDLSSTIGVPTVKPLPPIPILGRSKKKKDTFPTEQNDEEDNYDIVAPVLHNDEPRKTKPLPPIPTDLNVKSTANTLELTLSRQNEKKVDKKDFNNPEIWEQNTDPLPSQIHLNEYNDYPHLSQGEEPVVTQDVTHEVNAYNTDDFDSSDFSSEWDDTCSSTQEYSGQLFSGNKVARSASFSAGKKPVQRPSVVDEATKRSTPEKKCPPPFFRRRSSSLPQLLADSHTNEASEGRVGQADHWHTGNLQRLIDSRNQEEDVDEEKKEVQLLKEQKSIGLMVVGGLDTHLGMLYIKNIQPNSPAASCNRLRVGDQLLQVNDNCLVGVTHNEALNIKKNTPPLVKLTVARKKNNERKKIELVAEGRRAPDTEEPIVSSARESSTISKTASDLPVSPLPDRGQRPKSLISLSSFGTSFSNDPSPASPCGSLDDSDDYIPAYLEPESPTLTLRQDDVPVTIIDGIPGGYDSTTTEDEEEVKPVSKSVSWAVSSDDAKVFTVELLKNSRAGLGLSVTGGVDTSHEDIMVRQILSNSVTAHNGHIKKGDILLSVNGKSFKGLTNSEALTLLKDTPERVTLVVSRPLGHRQQSKATNPLRNKNPNKEKKTHFDAWPTREELTKKKNLKKANNATPPTFEKIPLDVAKQNGEHSTFDRLKKRFFSNGGPIRLQKLPHGPSVTEVTLEKGASGLGFSLGGGQDSLYGDAPIHVRYVFKESVAGRSGALKPGDEIIEVNGQRVAYMANVDVLELIRRLPYGPVVMKIRRK
ncbi:uncharacterized protein LOC111340749 [Stylophora pistillata]|nr:uncharacterized protein LOC111340749 [Stylophora pistillata]